VGKRFNELSNLRAAGPLLPLLLAAAQRLHVVCAV
jgi:hypothetical protein